MAIDKRTFKQGMNKDIDQRLIPDDQYRDGLNIKNLFGADGTMGVVTPIKGNIQKGTEFNFASGEALGGSQTLTITQIFWDMEYPKYWRFELDFNLTNGTSVYEPATTPTNSYMEFDLDEVLGQYDESLYTIMELHCYAAAELIGGAIQARIDADSTLASHIEVTVAANTVKIQCLQSGWDIGAPFYLDNYTTPASATAYTDQAIYPADKVRFDYAQVLSAPPAYVCVGVTKDEMTGNIYWLAHQLTGNKKKDWVLRYNEALDTITIVYSEYQDSKIGILDFNGSKKIHSIDVIGGKFLAWTDGINPPKKINISKSIGGYSFRQTYAKRFTDNHSATYSSPEFVDVEFEGVTNGLQDKLCFVSDTSLGLNPGDVIYVEQDEGFTYHEYNGYFKVTHVSSDGKRAVVNHEFIMSSPTTPGTLWKLMSYDESTGSYVYDFDPRERYWPEAYSNIYKHVKEQYINAHKRGPRDKATYTYLDDTSKKKNDLYGSVWQFSYRYVYDDDEVSAIAPISDVRIPGHMALNAVTGSSYAQSHHNKIKITIPHLKDGHESLTHVNTEGEFYQLGSGVRLHGDNKGLAERLYGWPTNIKAIEVYARESNKSPFLLIDTISWYTSLCTTAYQEDPNVSITHADTWFSGITVPSVTESTDPLKLNPVATNFVPFSDLVVYFFNDGIYPVLDNRNADKLYDWVPHTAATQAVIDNSSITYANVTDGFNLACKLDAGVEALYRSSNDAESPISPSVVSIETGEMFNSYRYDSFTPDDTTNWGNPNGVADNNETCIGNNAPGSYSSTAQYTLTNPCPGYANGNALVSWPGANGDWDAWESQGQRIRLILQLNLSNVPLDENGFVPMGTSFSSSGSFRWAYRYGPNNKRNRFGIGNRWTNITVSVSNEVTTLTDFGHDIAEAFKTIPNFYVPDVYGADSGNVQNWKTCEVFEQATHYAPVGANGKPGQHVYVYFRSTGEAAHSGDAVTKPKIKLFHFEHSSQVTDVAPTFASFKTGAYHDFGLVYGNNRNQTSFVMKSPDTRTYVKFPSERATGTTDSLNEDQTDTLGLPSIKWSINHTPPDWAEWYQWVYAGNTTVKDFLQFTSERTAKNLGDSGDRKIYLNLNSFKGEDYSYKKIDDPKIDYVFGEGDRIRFISNVNGPITQYIDVPITEARVYQYMTSETDIDPALSNPIREFVESITSNTEYKKKLMGGYWISFNAPDTDGFKWNDVSASNAAGYEGLLFEIYNPKKQTEEGPIYFYGFSDKIPIETDVKDGNRYHASDGTGVDQVWDTNTDSYTPATGYFSAGDVYLKGRRMVHKRTSATVVEYTAKTCEGYFANDFIKSDTYNKGRKHTYNQYAKEDHRNTTIYYSGPYLPSSNVNGLSEFNIIDLPFKEYSIGYGDIERIIEQDSNLIVLQSNKVSRIMVQKSILMGASGDSNVALSDQILSTAQPYAGDYGCGHAPESVVKHINRIYFVDPIRGVMCRLSTDGLTVISRNGMNSYFLKYFRERKGELGKHTPSLYYNHIAGIDPENNEYIYFGELVDEGRDPSFDETKNKTVGFYEDLNKYVSFYSYAPESLISLGSNFYSWKNGYIFLHNQDSAKHNYNKFYGVSYPSEIDIVFNAEPSMVKTFNNISIEGTYPWTPSVLETENFSATFQTGADGLHSSTGAHYWTRKEGVYYIPAPLGSKQEFKDYDENYSLEYEGVCEVVYNSVTSLTCSSNVSAFMSTTADGGSYVIFDGATPSVPVAVTVVSIAGTALVISDLGAGNFVATNTYFLAKKLSPCVGMEGEKPKGIFATCKFSINPSSYSYLTTAQDIIELYAINVDMDYSPLSYKNN